MEHDRRAVLPEKDEGDLLTGEDRAFARSLRERRVQRGLTQGDLAEILRNQGFSHMSHVAISRIEQLKRAARLGEARAIARALGVELSRMDSPPNAMLSILREVMDRPGKFTQELDVFRDSASIVGASWAEIESDLAMVEGILGAMREREGHDEATAVLLENYLEEARSARAIDPLLQASVDFERAVERVKAENADK